MTVEERAKQITIEHLSCSEEYFESRISELYCNSIISYYHGVLAGLNTNIEYVSELEEKIKHRNCVDCSNHGKQIEVLKLKSQLEKINDIVWKSNHKFSDFEEIKEIIIKK